MLPRLLVELFPVCIGWSGLVCLFFLLLGFRLALVAVAALTRIPVAAVLGAASEALTQLASCFCLFCINFDAVGVVKLIKFFLVDSLVFFALHRFQIIGNEIGLRPISSLQNPFSNLVGLWHPVQDQNNRFQDASVG